MKGHNVMQTVEYSSALKMKEKFYNLQYGGP